MLIHVTDYMQVSA